MSTVFEDFLHKSKPLAAAIGAAGLLAVAGCSSDVQRFSQVGNSTGASAPEHVASRPLEPLSANNIETGATTAPRYAGVQNATGQYSGADGSVRVGTGDTAYSIARANGVTVEDLAAANGLVFPYHVRFGQTLRIPGRSPGGVTRPMPRVAAAGTQAAPRAVSAGAHVVEPGETLYSVSRRFGINVRDLAAANGLTLSSGLQIGQRLIIPDGPVAGREQVAVGGPLNTVSSQPKPREVAAAQPAPRPAPVAQPEPEREVAAVQPSESIGPLAAPPSRTSSQFRWPVRGRLITRFGPQNDGTRNDGINISVPEGTSVKASEDGVVAYAGNELKGYGNLVLIRHADDWVTAYAHNSEILVNRGETVKRGQIIAKAGRSGSVTKPQVHFEVRKGAKAVDPLTYLEGA